MMTIYIDQDTRKRVNIYYTYKGFSRLDTPEIRERAGVIEVPDPIPPADYSDETYFRTEQDDAPYVVYTRKSDEQIAEVMLMKAKQQRAASVEQIQVTTIAGNVFDGDERSQDRMSRAVTSMDDTDSIPWVLSDNTITTVTKAELREALRLAGAAMAAEWVKPYAG